ncbi:MAG: SpoIIE family protein phosphatase [Leptospiraceae bacterium]|nr:SpoIIE family protein phosphatase [Leptospiraceae bacterium]
MLKFILKYLNIFKFIRDLNLQTKMISLITGVVLISVVPLSMIVLQRNQAVVRGKTLEVCRNLGDHISNLAREELLVDETYDATKSAVNRLKKSKIAGLKSIYVLNVDGKYVADLHETKTNTTLDKSENAAFLLLKDIQEEELKIGKDQILRFSYPISIIIQNKILPVGTAVFEFDSTEVYRPVEQIRTTIFTVSTAALGVAILIAILSALYFTRPIKKLTEGAQIIGEGKLSHRIVIKRQDEFGKLANRFNEMTAQIQDFTQNLEQKVQQRTEELNKSLQEVRALKIAQDGDYYLTSLLLNPLQPNNNNSSFIKTEFFIEQKKKFKFRKWDAQIGGDICISESIRLNGRNYTVVLNGDAMGKSIQGAGGALVLGVVFNAALSRTKLLRNEKFFPEIWLRERFLDLHNVFISFDGSMYISVFMALIEEDTGVMYYLNAEHPWTVLYRDNQASFLEEELMIRKLGTPDQEDMFRVRVFQMFDGDVVFTGSDGRDDLIIKNQQTGEEFIQEDETQFLRRVEEGEGILEKVVEKVRNTGKLMDDFSLIKITYQANPVLLESQNNFYNEYHEKIMKSDQLIKAGQEIEAIKYLEDLYSPDKKFPELLKILGRLYYSSKKYENARECLQNYISLIPTDNNYIYLLSDTYRNLGELEKAADYGERLFVRDQGHFLNLVNLVKIYYKLEIYSRALKMILRAVDMNPDAEEVSELYQNIVKSSKKGKSQIEEYELQPELQKKNIEEHLKKASEYYKAGKYIQAKMEYHHVLSLDETHTFAMWKLANTYFKLGEHLSATKYYNRCIALQPNNYQARNNIGKIHYLHKNFTEAKRQWERSLELNKSFQPARINLKKLKEEANV